MCPLPCVEQGLSDAGRPGVPAGALYPCPSCMHVKLLNRRDKPVTFTGAAGFRHGLRVSCDSVPVVTTEDFHTSFGTACPALAATQAVFLVLGSSHVSVPGGAGGLGGPKRWAWLESPLSPPLRPDLSAWEARPPSSTQWPFSHSDWRSRRSLYLLFWRVKGWGAAPESGIWAEAGRNLPQEKKGVGVGEGTPVSKQAAGVSACLASDQPCQQNMPQYVMTEAAPNRNTL